MRCITSAALSVAQSLARLLFSQKNSNSVPNVESTSVLRHLNKSRQQGRFAPGLANARPCLKRYASFELRDYE